MRVRKTIQMHSFAGFGRWNDTSLYIHSINGTQNQFLGYNSGKGTTTSADYNFIVGNYAASTGNLVGDDNIIIGRQAGYDIDIGFNNILLGYKPFEEPNSPIGVAKGINPGRVTWVRDIEATKFDDSGFWWDDNNTDQEVVNEMISKSI